MFSTIERWIDNLLQSILYALGLVGKEGTILLLGLDNAGKTTLLHKLRTGNILQFPPTERPHLESFECEGIKFIGWDLGGHEAVRHLWDDYIPESSAVVFLVDACDRNRFSEARDELDALVNEGAIEGCPLAILVNKSDLDGAATPEEVAGAIGFEELAMIHGEEEMAIFRTSIVLGEGYTEAFQWLSSML
mmetsp:Transcript_5397/g.7278  ORF Transcript_5397/g.7278 Transcript_5397/m.7278 type:complete len:191 (+) Transcript_5397:108-680(+)